MGDARARCGISRRRRLVAGPFSPFLGRTRTATGLLADEAETPPSYAFSALAAFAASRIDVRSTIPWLNALAEAIVAGRGLALRDRSETRQRNSLQAWPWIDGCFSWVEPRAWCLLLLKRMRSRGPDARIAARIAEAERLLFDRCCDGGGWNYGNAAVVDQSLDPFVPTTALALLALQDRPGHPLVTRSLAYLQAHAQSEPSGMALSLGLICLARFGMPTGALAEALVARYERSRFLDQLCLSHRGTQGIRFRAPDGFVVTAWSPVPQPNVGEIYSAQFCGWL